MPTSSPSRPDPQSGRDRLLVDLRSDLTPTSWRPGWLQHLEPFADDEDVDLPGALGLAGTWGQEAPAPGTGRTGELWSMLATLGSVDLTATRAVEPHLDALAILDQAGDPGTGERVGSGPGDRWGVFAAEGPGAALTARAEGTGWVLDGDKPWCSLAGHLSHAVVTARTTGGRRAFAIRLDDPGVTVLDAPWRSRGLADVRSGPIHLDAVPAVPVGADQWYLERPGFAWGGIGVAACCLGGAVGVARTLRSIAGVREPDQVARMHLGAVDARLFAAASALRHAAREVDQGAAAGAVGAVLASRVRSVVVDAVEAVIVHVSHATGPAPLTADERHARRVADLQVYVRQHHAERDLARLGQDLLAQESWGWW